MQEYEPHPTRSPLAETFGLTEREVLFNRLSDRRLQALLNLPDVTVHSATLDSNSYGEFLFLTVSRGYQGKRLSLTCYGLGYHDQRETWLQEVWAFYASDTPSIRSTPPLSLAEVQQILRQRRAEVERWAQDAPLPSQRALLFGILADLTDEDGAYSELEDLHDLDTRFDDEPQ